MQRYNISPIQSSTTSRFMSIIVLSGFITVADDDLSSVKQALAEHCQLTEQESGCLCFQVTQDPNNPNRFDVYEEFVDQAAFDFHQQRVAHSKWGHVSKNVERHYNITTKSLPKQE